LHPLGDELFSKSQRFCAISSGVERLLHTQEVAGSNPASRTTSSANRNYFNCRYLSLKMAEVLPLILTM
jgi:hypothetical protein